MLKKHPDHYQNQMKCTDAKTRTKTTVWQKAIALGTGRRRHTLATAMYTFNSLLSMPTMASGLEWMTG